MKIVKIIMILLVLSMLITTLNAKELIEKGSFKTELYSDFEFEGSKGTITTVANIRDSLNKYINTYVFLVGAYVDHIEGTNEYYIEDSHGIGMAVSSDQRPETKTKYNIYGAVSMYPASNNRGIIYEKIRAQYYEKAEDQKKNSPEYVISESKKRQQEEVLAKEKEVLAKEKEVLAQEKENSSKERNNLIIYILIGVVLVALIIVLIFTLNSSGRNTRQNREALLQRNIPPQASVNMQAGGSSSSTGMNETIQVSSGNTMRWIVRDKTTKYIPGKFVVVSERDRGTEFRMGGFPTANGNIVSLGRKKFNDIQPPERRQAHIEIEEKFTSVSREQLEIRERNGDLFVKNLSKTNHTKVNDIMLGENEESPLKTGDVLTLGELEIKYIV